jgi:cell division protein FtsL
MKTVISRTISPKILLTIAGAFLFNFLFWQEKMAINFLIFDLFIIGSVLSIYADALSRNSARWILAAHLISVGMVIIYNTLLSKFAAIVTLILYAAFAEYLHRSVIFAAGSMFYQVSFLLPEFRRLTIQASISTKNSKTPLRKLRLLLFPLGLLFIFYLIYLGGNRAFASISSHVFEAIGNYFETIFVYISWQRLCFILCGVYITGSLLIRSASANFSDKELSLSDRLIRTKPLRSKDPESSIFNEFVSGLMGKFAKGMLALKNKNLIGFISLVLLNGLLLLINVTDIVYIWLGDDYGKDAPMAELLHEGTGVLIFSILLAIIVVLYFFRGNLNFYKGNSKLKCMAYVWLAQNAILVASVCLRDYYYIANYGLAYKRLGVLFFLAIVLAGLGSVFIKIYHKKSNYFLFRFNGNLLLIMLVIGSFQNWDIIIAKYNIARIDKIQPDLRFLMSLSDQTLPIIRQNIDVLVEKSREPKSSYFSGFGTTVDLKEILATREESFLNEYQKHSWLSWNFADDAVYSSISRSQTSERSTSSVVQ